MVLTIFLAVIFCMAITVMLTAAVAFVQKKELFSSAPEEARVLIRERDRELFRGARVMGRIMLAMSVLTIAGVCVIAVRDGFRSGFTFREFFSRFAVILTIYKLYDMICFDYFLLMKFHFFQYYYPEVKGVYPLKKYGYNMKSQLLKLLVIFPAVSALAAWICSLF